MDKIKLVIWDLDETFWKGTLSEEGITPIEYNSSIVKELAKRGVMNSIVSKNNFEHAKQKLEELGIWDFFIFPKIAWEAKGQLVKQVIEDCQLRAPNTLFIDDNHANLQEAKFYNESLNVESPSFIKEMLSHPSLQGKEDTNLSRLQQYKTLEKKQQSRLQYSSNAEFLKESDITISRINGEDVLLYFDRIIELVERTNQLNFTKIRSSKEELEFLFKTKGIKLELLKVKDRFGDYGIVGFYALDVEKNKLIHFVFSCRILNLGVAQYIYSKLNFPDLEIVPDVAEKLDMVSKPDWIKEEFRKIEVQNYKSNNSVKVFFKGGCDLGQMTYYLQSKGFDFIEETNYVTSLNFPIHQEHTIVLLDSFLESDENKRYVVENSFIPFVDENFYKTKLFQEKYNCLVYSLLMDYTQEIYKHKTKNIKIPFGGYYGHWTDKDAESELLKRYSKRNFGITNETFAAFREEFDHVGQISAEDFISNLVKIRSLVPEHIPIIFINGVEFDSPDKKEIGACERHKEMNLALDKFISQSVNTYLLDVRTIIKNEKQLTNNLRHYNREVYQEMSINLLDILNTVLNLNIDVRLDFFKVVSDRLRKNQLVKRILNFYVSSKNLVKNFFK
jgi:FkbH-like protein